MSKLTIGLTGGIGSGKSFISEQFEALGIPVRDADQVARDVVAPGTPALAEIAEHFGADFIDASGQLNRRKMREHVFANPTELRLLEAITHPRIYEGLRDWRDAQTTPYCMISIAILLETRMKRLIDRVLVVDASVETQRQRLMKRDGIDADLADRMIKAQASRETRLAAANEVIVNDGGDADTVAQVQKLHRQYLEIAAGT